MLFRIFLALSGLGLLRCVEAGTWNNFVKNLTTGLAPLIILFGESVTKQWLSESLTVWDNLLFAIGPLGVITAVVSVIRVAGSPSLKAFIGRAQESPGTAELELISCTGGTTAELWNEGGIARVFRRPYISEIVTRSSTDCPIELIDKSVAWSMGGSEVDSSNLERGRDFPRTTRVKNILMGDEEEESGNLGSPNLSLNVGTRRKPKSCFRNAALVGVILQSGVLAFAALSVYTYPANFSVSPRQLSTTTEADSFYPAQPWAFHVAFSGTVCLCLGMFLCAFMMERRSNETYFRKNSPAQEMKNDSVSKQTNKEVDASFRNGDGDNYWAQMGDQNIGDQVFHKHPDNQIHIRSQKGEAVFSWESVLLWCTLVVTILGFLLQFVGMRYLHPSVALSQLGLTIIMTIIRSNLRTQRLSVDGNLISGRSPRRVNGQELDFSALYPDTSRVLSPVDIEYLTFRGIKVTRKPGSFHVRLSPSKTAQTSEPTTNRIKRIFNIKSWLAELTSAMVMIRSSTSELKGSLEWKDFQVQATAVILKDTIEGVRMKFLTYLISRGAEFHHPHLNYLWSALGLAARNWHGMVVGMLFGRLELDEDNLLEPAEYFGIEEFSKPKKMTLLEAAAGGHLAVVQELITKGANVNSLSEFDHTPLSVAAAGGHTAVVALLCDHGAELEVIEDAEHMKTPLSIAVSNGHKDTVSLLLSKGAIMDRPYEEFDGPEVTTVLIEAVQTGNLEMVELLVQEGAQIDGHDEEYMTAFSHAAQLENLEIANFLIAKKADVLRSDLQDTTPLQFTMREESARVARALFAAGALNYEKDSINRFLLLAAEKGCSALCEVLIDYGANPNVYSITNHTESQLEHPPESSSHATEAPHYTEVPYVSRRYPLEAAAQEGHVETVKVLLDRGADPNLKTENFSATELLSTEFLPITSAAIVGRWEMVELLLEKSTSLYDEPDDDFSVLACAAEDGKIEIVKFLLERYTALDIPHGAWPLYRAALNGQLEIVKILVEDGASTLWTKDCLSALDAAKDFITRHPSDKHEEIIKILELRLVSPNIKRFLAKHHI